MVEREVRLTNVVVNGPDFDRRREAALASEVTMVRDTDQGLRYLTPRARPRASAWSRTAFDTNRLFLLGGVFYDDSLDYPLPLAGVNYFDLDFRGTEGQLNAFFAGVLGIVNYADPHLFGTKLDAGFDLFAMAIATSDQLYRDGEESVAEEVEERPLNATLNLGHPLGQFVKVNGSYGFSYGNYGRADDTAPEFVLPDDNLTQTLGLGLQFSRSGYRLALSGAVSQRSEWELWGLPDNTEFDPEHEDYTTWESRRARTGTCRTSASSASSSSTLGGEDLDRFRKYQFGFFGGTRVHGYQIDKVRAEEAYAAHVTYGFELGKLLRLDGVGDAAWATDETSGLDNELLAGVGVAGYLHGPVGDDRLDRHRRAGRRPGRRLRRLPRLPEAVQVGDRPRAACASLRGWATGAPKTTSRPANRRRSSCRSRTCSICTASCRVTSPRSSPTTSTAPGPPASPACA